MENEVSFVMHDVITFLEFKLHFWWYRMHCTFGCCRDYR